MSFFPKNQHYIGIDYEMSTLKIATLCKKRGNWQILALQEGENLDQLEAFSDDAIFSSTISSRDILIRSLDIPLKRDKDIFSALSFQAESLFPFAIENAVVQGQIVKRDAGQTRLSVAAAQKNLISSHIQSLPITPDVVTSTHFALAAFSGLFPEGRFRQLLIYSGKQNVFCCLVEKGRLLRAHTFDIQADFEAEVRKVVLAFGSGKFESVLLLGNRSAIDLVSDTVGKKTLLPSQGCFDFSQKQLMEFAPAIGAAMIGAEKKGINFRQNILPSSYPWKRVKKPLILFFASTTILFFSLMSWSRLALTHQKMGVDAHFQTLLIQEKRSSRSPRSPGEYHAQLNEIEQEVKARPETFALLPAVPKASDVLSWLATHPNANGMIEISTLNYNMIKRPDLTQKKERYRVRVSLDFTAQTPSAARAFHEALIAPNPFVDAKGEVQWTMNKDGSYRATFYLKDKTKYV